MDFPGNILNRISRMFDSDNDEILVFILIFLFIFLSDQTEEKHSENSKGFNIGMPVIFIAAFIILLLVIGNEKESII